MEIYLMRHPAVSTQGICYGQSEAALRPDWLTRLPAVKKMLPQPLPHVFTSPAPRCQVVAGFLGGPAVTVDERLAELDFGNWEGRPWQELPPEEVALWADDLEGAAPHGGETGEQMLDRAADFIEVLFARDEDALVVTHAGWIRALLAILLGTDLDHAFRMNIDFLSLTQITCNGDMVNLSYINRT